MNWSVYVDENYLVYGWNEQLVEFILHWYWEVALYYIDKLLENIIKQAL